MIEVTPSPSGSPAGTAGAGGRPSVRRVPAAELSPCEYARWTELQEADPVFASPFLSAEFTLCASAVWPGIEVAVLESGDQMVGFFPYQRSGRAGYPVGGRLAFHQAVVCEPGIAVDPAALVHGLGLRELNFTNLLECRGAFTPPAHSSGVSLQADLSGGFDAWVAAVGAVHAKMIPEIRRKSRKLGREVGDVRLVVRDDPSRVFEEIARHKFERFRFPPLLRDASYVAMVERLLAMSTPQCTGCASVLYAGDRLVAGSIGLRSQTMFLGMIIAHVEELNRYSPGSILLIELLHALAEDGVTTFDFGYGDQEYKRRLAQGAVTLAEGFVAADAISRARCVVRREVRDRQCRLLNEGLLAPERTLGRAARALRTAADTREVGPAR